MSEKQAAISFEMLPSELLFECFKYLNAIDIFHSFDGLNYRFCTLLRRIHLYVNFRNMEKSRFDQFCMKLSSNAEIKEQIYSLRLSNKNFCQIHLFLSRLSYDGFTNLRSLILTEVDERNVSQLKLMVSSLYKLSCFRMFECGDTHTEILSQLQTNHLKTLTVPNVFRENEPSVLCDISSLKSLTFNFRDMNELCQVLKSAPQLRYLNVQDSSYPGPLAFVDDDDSRKKWSYAFHLKELVVTQSATGFYEVETLLKLTPNLESLSVFSYRRKNIMEADRWENLITSSLPHLKSFNFKFAYSDRVGEKEFYDKFKRFQTDFWQKQHHWYTEFTVSGVYYFLIHTIPYVSEKYTLRSYTKRYFNEQMSTTDTFNNVTNLEIALDALPDKSQFYFPNVVSLAIGNISRFDQNSCIDEIHVQLLQEIINFTHITSLHIVEPHCMIKNSSVLVNILKEAPNISSIAFGGDHLMKLLNDDELCECLKKMIKKLIITSYSESLLKKLSCMNRLWETVLNIEQLSLYVNKPETLVFLLKHLPKLLRIDGYRQNKFSSSEELLIVKEDIRKLNIQILPDSCTTDGVSQSIRIIRNTE